MATYTTAQRDALAAAIADGATSVSYDGKTVTYRSLNEMLRTLAIIERSLTGTPALKTARASVSKGLR